MNNYRDNHLDPYRNAFGSLLEQSQMVDEPAPAPPAKHKLFDPSKSNHKYFVPVPKVKRNKSNAVRNSKGRFSRLMPQFNSRQPNIKKNYYLEPDTDIILKKILKIEGVTQSLFVRDLVKREISRLTIEHDKFFNNN